MEKTVLMSLSPEELQTIIVDCLNKCLADKNKQAQIDATVYSTMEVAKMFKISTKTVQNWRDSGILGYAKICNKIFYRQAHIDKLLEKHNVRPLK